MAFIVEMTFGLVAGAVGGTFALYRWRIHYPYALLAAVVIAILVASLPLTLSLRVGVIAGWLSGFAVGGSLLGRGPDRPDSARGL